MTSCNIEREEFMTRRNSIVSVAEAREEGISRRVLHVAASYICDEFMSK